MPDFFHNTRVQELDQTNPRGGTLFYGVTLGKVVSTKDPHQMGRLYVHCPELGDPVDMSPEDFEDLPLCTYCSPLGGTATSTLARGPSTDPEKNLTNGPVTYGMWNIPKAGATVAVMCVDGNPTQRLWVGCIYDQFVTNTMPHGRFFLEDEFGNVPHPDGAPYGPLSGTEEHIQPLFDNQTEAFERRDHNFEWRTRGMDYQISAIFDNYLDPSPCNITDDEEVVFEQEDGSVIIVVQGMAETMDRTDALSPDSQVYAWTTPGFHSISMDDRLENCRMHFRTTAGHQIILDDTNERIYINTCKGNNWIELDEDGCIDVYSNTKISVNAPDINLIGEATVRLFAYDSIHLKTEGSIFLDAVKNIQMTAGGDIMHTAGGNILDNAGAVIKHTAAGAIEDNAGAAIKHTAATSIDQKASGAINQTAGSSLNLKAGDAILATAGVIHLNGPGAGSASASSKAPKADPLDCFWPSRYPHREPWARTGTMDDNSLEPKYPYDDPMVGREHKVRDEHWRR